MKECPCFEIVLGFKALCRGLFEFFTLYFLLNTCKRFKDCFECLICHQFRLTDCQASFENVVQFFRMAKWGDYRGFFVHFSRSHERIWSPLMSRCRDSHTSTFWVGGFDFIFMLFQWWSSQKAFFSPDLFSRVRSLDFLKSHLWVQIVHDIFELPRSM